MRVLTLTSLFPTVSDELVAPFIGERVDALSRLCTVQVVSPQPSPVPNSRVTTALFRKHSIIQPSYFALPESLKQFDGCSLYWSSLKTVLELHNTSAFDVIDSHWSYPDGYAAVRLGRQLGIPVVITVRGSDIHRFLRLRHIAPLVKRAMARADSCIAVSESLRRQALDCGVVQPHFSVIRNGIDPREFTYQEKQTARGVSGIAENERAILYVGRLVPNKRLDLLIRSVAKLDGAKLFIVGVEDPRWRGYARDLFALVAALNLEHLVQFVGPVPPSRLKHWYGSADCLCLCSDDEGCPNVVIEALACGTPVVARAVGGVPELVTHQSNGLLVQSDEPEELAHQLQSAIGTVWDRTRIARLGRERTWDDVGNEAFVHLTSTIGRFRKRAN
jgi:teichuronic acid biosynthesis glycosyltransferase TuaC